MAAALEPALPYESGFLGYPLIPIYLRGESFLALRDVPRAAAESLKLMNHCPHFGNLACTLARLQLACADVLAGESAKAKSEYSKFLALWKDADPDVPLLKEATAEYAKLQ